MTPTIAPSRIPKLLGQTLHTLASELTQDGKEFVANRFGLGRFSFD